MLLAVLGSGTLIFLSTRSISAVQYVVQRSCIMHAACRAWQRRAFLVLAAFLQYNALCIVPASCMRLVVLGIGTLSLCLRHHKSAMLCQACLCAARLVSLMQRAMSNASAFLVLLA